MTEITQQLNASFTSHLKNLTDFSDNEIEALFFLLSCLAIDPRFSLVRVANASKGRYDRKFIAKLLTTFLSVQDQVLRGICQEIIIQKGRRARIFLALDDQLVRKRGKKVFGVFRWVDHNMRRKVLAYCIVDVAIVIQGEVLGVMPYLLLKNKGTCQKAPKKRSQTNKEQDAKTVAALKLVRKVVDWLEELKVNRKKIGVLTDRWFANQDFKGAVQHMKLEYRLACKKNYVVNVPDSKRIQRRKKGGRGRKAQIFVRTRRLDEHFETVTQGGSFLDQRTGKRVRWKCAVVTFKTLGRAQIYAFWREGCQEPLFVLTPARYKATPQPETVYRDYSYRWRIEEVHRDLKQQFGLGKLRNRTESVVMGFIGLVYTFYSVFLLMRQRALKNTSNRLTAPQCQDEMFQLLYIEQGVNFT